MGGTYQPWGTCTGAIVHWVTRVVGKEEDPDGMGRSSKIRVKIEGTVISMITAYSMQSSSEPEN